MTARDGALRRRVAERDGTPGDADLRLRAFVDLALDDPGPLGRSFWLAAAAEVIVASTERRRDLYDLAVRRIHATFRVDLRERHDAVRVLAERILPIA